MILMQIGSVCATELSSSNIQEALFYCNQYLGAGLYDEKMLTEISNKEHHYFFLLSRDGQSIGIFYCYAAPWSEIEKVIHATVPKEEGLVGINRSIVLSPAVRGQGLSDLLLNAFSQMLYEREHVRTIYTLAWVRNGFIPAAGHLSRCGYSFSERIPHPWSETKGLRCPACEKTHCICDGALYQKRFL